MKGWNGGECGVVAGKWCATGSSYVAGPGKLYYGYCVGYDKNLAKRNDHIIPGNKNDGNGDGLTLVGDDGVGADMNPIEEDGAQADLTHIGDNVMSSDLPLVGDGDVTSGMNHVEKDDEAILE